jgi:glucose/arabinose dehydrogenase
MRRIHYLALVIVALGVLAVLIGLANAPIRGQGAARFLLPWFGNRTETAQPPAPTSTPAATPTASATVLVTIAFSLTVSPTVVASPTVATPEVARSTPAASPVPATATPSSPTASPTVMKWPQLALTPFVAGLRSPVQITHAGDGSKRIFVVQQTGQIRIIQDGALRAEPFLDLADRVSCCGERGLLSVAFPPDYAARGHFYVNYTNRSGDTVVSRFGLTADLDVADSASEEIVLAVQQPFANHNGGQLAFGVNDGYLHIGMGDGGSAGDPENRGQNPAELLGKLLRVDVEAGVSPYAIPAANPFTQTVGYRGEIWALGLRNPWRFAFDRMNGDLYIADVGQNEYEEVDHQPAASGGGENYGWRIMEGTHCYKASDCDSAGLILPVAEYDHSQGCSVTGGVVYRGIQFDRLVGMYLYGDYCSGRIWGLRQTGAGWANQLLLETTFNIAAFGEDEAGEIYVTDYAGGNIYRIVDQS